MSAQVEQLQQTRARRLANLAQLRQALAAYEQVPTYEENPDYYRDWGELFDFEVKVGKGECAM